jgi:class 3 adenylate cyclase/tetratricopeptide (TPR) repeat protein
METRRSRLAWNVMLGLSKVVIHGLKPRHPTRRVFQRCRWQTEGQRNILFHEGLRFLGAEDHRMDVVAWLRGLGLEQYAPAFRDNDVDGEVLPELTSDDLISIGVTSVGHRRKLLAAIAALGTQPPTAAQLAASASSAPTSLAIIDAERRQLTVMFCDLVGSTALSARLDPEDMREIIAAYHRAVTEIVVECGGTVSRYMGDGVLVYFGYPKAHEDDAERAVRAGLGAVEIVSSIDVQSVKLQARVGIATGLVIVGDLIGAGSAQERSVVGETPNLAARLQSLAAPGTVVITAGTRRLLGALFEYRELGEFEVKGIDSPVAVWQVLRPSAVASRFEALHGASLSGLIGREEEIDLLLRRWARAKAADGQVVLVSGEAGIGKSRIVATLAERLDSEPAVELRYFCSPYHQDSALFPFIDQFARAADFAREDSSAVKLQKLAALAVRAGPPEEDLAFLADLLSLPVSERHPLPNLSPQRKKERTFEALMRQLEGLARRQPVLMTVEDAHWIDPTSRELLDLIVERVRNLSVLLVVTFRPEFQPPWTGQARVSVLALNRLDRRDLTALVLQIAGGKAVPGEVVERIAERTDGVPLFIEEMTKSILESGLLREEADRYVLDRPLSTFAIPTSLHDSLTARLDRLGSVRHVAQIGAAIGREFSYGLLQKVSGLSEEELQAALARLVASELLFHRGTPPDAVYTFKHALVQDAAHGSLLRGSRQQLHAQIAEALATHLPELMDSQPELFAQHFAEAGLVEKSVDYWGRAGSWSAAHSAMAEAAAQFQKGLDQLALLPETPERRRQELEFWSALGAAYRYVKGQAAPEMGHAFARARELWELLGSPSEFLHVPYGESRYHAYRGELDVAQRLDEDLLRLSRERNDSAGIVLGHDCSSRDLLLAGRFTSARSHIEQVLALYDPIAHRSLVHHTGSDPRVVSQGYLGIVLFCLGFSKQAMVQSNAAIAEARKLAHPPSLAASLAQGARLLSLGGDDAALDERASELLALASEQRFPLYHSLGMIYCGWGKVVKGDVAGGISLLRSGSMAYRATDAQTLISFYIALLAKACEIGGQVDEAFSLIDEGLQIVERIGERWFAAEMYRQKGELMRKRHQWRSAEELYRKALAIAGEQNTKLWELRAVTSLARLCLDRDRSAEARDLLAPIYSWFTEGFGTPDLKSAKALLNELS